MRVPEAVIFDQDNRCFELRKSGFSYSQIAKALDCSVGRAHAGVKRCMDRISTKLAEDNRDQHRMQLERLDAMLVNLWPLTMSRDVEKEDGSGKIRVPPSMDAVDRVLKIFDRQAKLLGLDTQVVQLTGGDNARGDIILGGGKMREIAETSPKVEALQLLRLLAENEVIDPSTVSDLTRLHNLEIVDAEVIEEERAVATLDDDFDDSLPYFPAMPDGENPSTDG